MAVCFFLFLFEACSFIHPSLSIALCMVLTYNKSFGYLRLRRRNVGGWGGSKGLWVCGRVRNRELDMRKGLRRGEGIVTNERF